MIPIGRSIIKKFTLEVTGVGYPPPLIYRYISLATSFKHEAPSRKLSGSKHLTPTPVDKKILTLSFKEAPPRNLLTIGFAGY